MNVKTIYKCISYATYEGLIELMNHYHHPTVITQPIRDAHCWHMGISYIVTTEEEIKGDRADEIVP